jgi:hypothetical protein
MPDQPQSPSPTPKDRSATPGEGAPAGPFATGPTINIADEFGTAKRNLPPMLTVGIAVVVVAIAVGIVSFVQRAKPQGSGSIDNIAVAAVPGQDTVLVAITFTLRNAPDKPFWVHELGGTIKTATGEVSASAVSAVDFERYFQAFPVLKENAQPALSPETKLQPGEAIKRTILVGFPVTQEAFAQRQSLSVVIHPYDQQVAVILTK